MKFCQYRLPCGYCTKLNRDCPKLGNSVSTIETYKFDTTAVSLGPSPSAILEKTADNILDSLDKNLSRAHY